jgi:hypothetical protein
MTDESKIFLDELIQELGEERATLVLEEAAQFRSIRQRYLSGAPAGMRALIESIASWEASDEMPIFLHQFVPALRESLLFVPVERFAALIKSSDPSKATAILAAVELLRNVANGSIGKEILAMSPSTIN